MPFNIPNALKGMPSTLPQEPKHMAQDDLYHHLPSSPVSPSFRTPTPKPKAWTANSLYDPPVPHTIPTSRPRPGTSSSTTCLPGPPRHGPLIDLDPYDGEDEEYTMGAVGELKAEMDLVGLVFDSPAPAPESGNGQGKEDEKLVDVEGQFTKIEKVDASSRRRRGADERQGTSGMAAVDMLRGARQDAAWRVRMRQQALEQEKEKRKAEMEIAKRKQREYLKGVSGSETEAAESKGKQKEEEEEEEVMFDGEAAEAEDGEVFEGDMEVVDYDFDEDDDVARDADVRAVDDDSSDEGWCSTSDIAPSEEEEEASGGPKATDKTLTSKLLSLANKKKKAAKKAAGKVMDAALAELVGSETAGWAEEVGHADTTGLDEVMAQMEIAEEGMEEVKLGKW